MYNVKGMLMNTAQIVEQVKEVIMKELLTDIDDKHCVLDLCIENKPSLEGS